MINQTRTLLAVALLVVAVLLWQQWQHDYPATPSLPPPSSTQVANAVPATAATNAAVPDVPSGAPARAAAAIPAGAHAAAEAATPARELVTASNDVLKLTIDPRGGSIVGAELLDYPQTVKRGSGPVQLLDTQASTFYVAQDGLVAGAGSAAPNHLALFTPEATSYTLANGDKQVTVTLKWQDPASGVGVTKRYVLTRGSYVVGLSQEVTNHGSATWRGSAYEQLDRVEPPPPPKHFLEFYNPDTFAYTGAAWYSPGDKFNKLKFGNFEKEPLHKGVTGGWIAMTQRFFVTAWIPDAKQAEQFASALVPGDAANAKPRYLIRTVGPELAVAPGASAVTSARLYVGPNLQEQLGGVAPGLDLTVDYGMVTVIAQPLFKLLSWLHRLVGNWGVAIITLVLVIQGLTWKLTEAQYKSGARMRKLQPRLAALKERFGDDKQKYQQAMMELYKKEKINPMAGCLPNLIILPIFFALYYVLIFSVELRHAAFLWIPDLSAADPLFILPVLYTLTMVGTSFLTPAQGMDPTQAKMMKVMPLLFSVLFYFFPAGLTLYYVVRGICMLGQQWYVTRKVEQADARARA